METEPRGMTADEYRRAFREALAPRPERGRMTADEYIRAFREAVAAGPGPLMLFVGADPDRFHNTMRGLVACLDRQAREH